MEAKKFESRELSFSNVEEVLDYAIQSEKDAYHFYTEWAKKVEKPGIKTMFQELAQEEVGHEKFLKDFKKGKIRKLPRGKVTDLKISDYLIEPDASVDLDYQDALILAMHRERHAFRMYSHLAKASSSKKYKKLFEMLAQQEAKHKLRLELMYDDDILTDN